MQILNNFRQDVADFKKDIIIYSRKRLSRIWWWLEAKKDILVRVLYVKRGLYQRSFLHTSLVVLISAGVIGGPMIANSYPTVAVDSLQEFTPPSAVLSSFDEQETTTQQSEKPRDNILVHAVKEGDTLAGLAEKYGVSVDSIKWLNTNLSGEKLAIGQEVQIPPVTGVVHKVKRGETVYSIAKKYNTDAQQIVNWPFNNFTDLDTFALASGQTLVVPDGVMPEEQPVYTPRMIAQVGLNPGDGRFIWPTQGIITQRPVSYHMALDIANSSLPPIGSADGGTVVLTEKQRYGYGWHIIIDHGNGYQTLYGHLSDIYVSPGQAVSKGSIIGRMGSTGRSTGTHLHFEIRKGGVLLNPLGFLK